MLWTRWLEPWGFPNPWAEMRRIQREMNRLFQDFEPARTAAGGPPANLWQGKDDAVVTMEVPGVAPENLDISVVGDQLTVRGKREPEDQGKESSCVRQERFSGEFVRTLQLPFRIDADKVKAEVEHGVLKVVLPRHEQDKPRQIAVKCG